MYTFVTTQAKFCSTVITPQSNDKLDMRMKWNEVMRNCCQVFGMVQVWRFNAIVRRNVCVFLNEQTFTGVESFWPYFLIYWRKYGKSLDINLLGKERVRKVFTGTTNHFYDKFHGKKNLLKKKHKQKFTKKYTKSNFPKKENVK